MRTLLFSLLVVVAGALLITRPSEPPLLLTPEGTKISLLIADTDAKRTLGLGKRVAIAESEGMLFVFSEPGRHGIWMKDMRFPLDIIWLAPSSSAKQKLKGLEKSRVDIDSGSRIDSNTATELLVVDIKENVGPETYPSVFYPDADASYVLEMGASGAAKNNITFGSVLTVKK